MGQFEYKQITSLPLPAPKDGETHKTIADRGMEVALRLLHSHEEMIKADKDGLQYRRIKPTDKQAVKVGQLATQFKVHLDPSDDLMSSDGQWKHFEITENVPLLFGFTKQIVFQTALRFNNHGMEALSDPGSGVILYGSHVVKRNETNERCLELIEHSETCCSFWLAWYIKSTMDKHHRKVHSFLRSRFVEEMKRKKAKSPSRKARQV